jgi:hypothetical protein
MDSSRILAGFKKKPGITISAALILAVLVGVYIRYDQLEMHQTSLTDLRENLVKLQRNVVNSAQLDRQLSDIKEINSKITGAALRPSELARNLQFFYTLEVGNNVKLLDLRQQTTATPPPGAAAQVYIPIRFEVNMAGEYEQLLKVMREIEKTFVGGSVVSAVITPGAAVPGQNPDKARLLSMVVQGVAINQ